MLIWIIRNIRNHKVGTNVNMNYKKYCLKYVKCRNNSTEN